MIDTGLYLNENELYLFADLYDNRIVFIALGENKKDFSDLLQINGDGVAICHYINRKHGVGKSLSIDGIDIL